MLGVIVVLSSLANYFNKSLPINTLEICIAGVNKWNHSLLLLCYILEVNSSINTKYLLFIQLCRAHPSGSCPPSPSVASCPTMDTSNSYVRSTSSSCACSPPKMTSSIPRAGSSSSSSSCDGTASTRSSCTCSTSSYPNNAVCLGHILHNRAKSMPR